MIAPSTCCTLRTITSSIWLLLVSLGYLLKPTHRRGTHSASLPPPLSFLVFGATTVHHLPCCQLTQSLMFLLSILLLLNCADVRDGDDCGGKTKTGEGGGRYDIRENDNSRRAPASSRIASSPSHTLSLNLTFGSRNISTEDPHTSHGIFVQSADADCPFSHIR